MSVSLFLSSKTQIFTKIISLPQGGADMILSATETTKKKPRPVLLRATIVNGLGACHLYWTTYSVKQMQKRLSPSPLRNQWIPLDCEDGVERAAAKPCISARPPREIVTCTVTAAPNQYNKQKTRASGQELEPVQVHGCAHEFSSALTLKHVRPSSET